MLKNINFQIIILGLFVFFIIAGVVAFATFRGGGDDDSFDAVVLWGTIPQEDMNTLIQSVQVELRRDFPVTYREIPESGFDTTFVEALASGRGPDLVLLPQDLIVRHQDKIFPIPYESFPERDFRDRFVEEGELYLSPQGVVALPLTIDPLVLYWNRTLFSNAGLPQPPQFWDELVSVTQRVTKRDAGGNITQSAIALGGFDNISHAKEILSTLIFQAGNPIVRKTNTGALEVVLGDRLGAPESPAESAVRFYTEFANPVKSVYSWNPSLPESRAMFLSGDLALYIGFASELFSLQERNPNLNFDVAELPQVRDGPVQATFGRMQGIAVVRTSPNTNSAFRALLAFTDAEVLSLWNDITGLPSVRRDMLVDTPEDPFVGLFNRSALIADAFLDPDPSETNFILRDMIESVTSGRERITRAVSQADARLEQLVQ